MIPWGIEYWHRGPWQAEAALARGLHSTVASLPLRQAGLGGMGLGGHGPLPATSDIVLISQGQPGS